MDIAEIVTILQRLGTRLPSDSQLILVGGSALALLGSPRLTIDIDFIGDDVHPNSLHRAIMQIARDMQIHVEPVPLERFVPLPEGNEERVIRIGQFGNLEVFVADPYSIALSKLDRGLGTGQRIQEVPFCAVATVRHEINFHEARLFVTPGCESPNDDLLFEQAARLGGTQAL